MPVYLRFLIIFFLLPTLVFAATRFPHLKKYPKTFSLVVFFTFLFGVPWDTLSVKTGLWWYDAAPTLGIWWGVLPLEEYFFTLLFPIFVVTVTLLITKRAA